MDITATKCVLMILHKGFLGGVLELIKVREPWEWTKFSDTKERTTLLATRDYYNGFINDLGKCGKIAQNNFPGCHFTGVQPFSFKF